MVRKTVLSLTITILFSSLAFSQSEEAAWQKRTEERIKRKNERIMEILVEKFPNKKLQKLKSLPQEQRLAHRNKLFELYYKAKEEKGLRIGTPPYYYYYTHLHPDKLDKLRQIGIKYLFADYPFDERSYKDYVLYGEVVIIGRVRKFVYHPEENRVFRTSVIVVVDEYLRDDFGLAETTNEVVIKLMAGPLEGGRWVATSNDLNFKIGEQYLLYLTRYSYLSMLIDRSDAAEKLTVEPNEFVIPTMEIYPIRNSMVTIEGENLDINEVKRGIRQVVEILDVENFFGYSQ